MDADSLKGGQATLSQGREPLRWSVDNGRDGVYICVDVHVDH